MCPVASAAGPSVFVWMSMMIKFDPNSIIYQNVCVFSEKTNEKNSQHIEGPYHLNRSEADSIIDKVRERANHALEPFAVFVYRFVIYPKAI